MGTHAGITTQGVRIDTAAWLQQRTAGTFHILTADLHLWAHDPANRVAPASAMAGHAVGGPASGSLAVGSPAEVGYAGSAGPGAGDPAREWAAGERFWPEAVLSWCRDRRYGSLEARGSQPGPTVIRHVGTRLDTAVWVARARSATHGPIAVVQLGDQPPVVYRDSVTDPAVWYDADTVLISCPLGHQWTWRTGRELLDARGRFTTVAVVFGPSLDAPFSPCLTCAAHALGQRAARCGCDGRPWIVCPTCRRRCDVHLRQP